MEAVLFEQCTLAVLGLLCRFDYYIQHSHFGWSIYKPHVGITLEYHKHPTDFGSGSGLGLGLGLRLRLGSV